MVRTLRAELGTEHGTIQRVAAQLGYGTGSVRLRVRQADVEEGHLTGVSTSESARREVGTKAFYNHGKRGLAPSGRRP